MDKAEFIKAHRAANGSSIVEAEYAFYRAYPVEHIKQDPFLCWLWMRCEELDRRIKQLEQERNK